MIAVIMQYGQNGSNNKNDNRERNNYGADYPSCGFSFSRLAALIILASASSPKRM